MKKLKPVISYQLSVITFILFTVFCTLAQKPSETPPPPSQPRSVNIPEVKEMTLPNGLKVVVVQRRNLPLVTVSLLIRSGADIEDDNQAGLANMTADLLIKGTEFRTATQIAEQIDFLGGSLNSGASWNASTVTLNIMKDKLGKALSIMSDAVIRPNFPEKEVSLAKKQTLDGFAVSLTQPGTLLAYVASRYTYDEHPSIGTMQTIGKIRRNDIVTFHKENYVPDNSVLIITGDITPDQAFRFAELFYGGWQKTPVRKEIIANIMEAPKEHPKIFTSRSDVVQKIPVVDRMLVVDLPDSGQAAVGYAKKLYTGRANCFGEEEAENIKCGSSAIYYPASVLNSVLGGSYSSRLNQEIRLKRGLSYGARSGFAWRGFDTNFNVNTQTKNESAAEVADLIQIEIEKLANESILEEEMIPRKAVVVGGFGRGLQSNDDLAARLRDLYLYDISPNELNSFINDVGEVTDDDIKNFASDNLMSGDVIIVGDAKLFMDDLKKRFPNQKIEVIKASDLDLNSPNLRKRGSRSKK